MKQFLRRIGFIVFVVLIFSYIFVWFYETPKRKAIAEGSHDKLVKWNAIHNSDHSYDMIILGSSRGYSAYNPIIIDSIAHTNSYNMCTGSQNIVETYFMLKEIFKFQKPEIVVYEIFLPSFKNEPDYYHVLENAQFMSTSSQFDMIFNGFGSKAFIRFLIPILKYKYYLKEHVYNFTLLRNNNPDYSTAYWINGYYYSDEIVDSITAKKLPPIYSFKNTEVSVPNIAKNFKALTTLCKENGAKLICVRAPYPPSRLKNSPEDTESAYFKNICREYSIPFYDFNYLSSDIYEDFDFVDHHHMNYIGANKVSKQLGEILNRLQSHENVTKE